MAIKSSRGKSFVGIPVFIHLFKGRDNYLLPPSTVTCGNSGRRLLSAGRQATRVHTSNQPEVQIKQHTNHQYPIRNPTTYHILNNCWHALGSTPNVFITATELPRDRRSRLLLYSSRSRHFLIHIRTPRIMPVRSLIPTNASTLNANA